MANLVSEASVVAHLVNPLRAPAAAAMSHRTLPANAELIDAPTSESISAKRRRIVLAATIGNTLEWYDFLGLRPAGGDDRQAVLSRGQRAQFVAAVDGHVRSWAGDAAGRAIVLGTYADRVGRKAALSWTILIMALGTGLIAVAPTYERIGIYAPLLIVLARLLQGFSCGGEMGGAIAFLAENAPEGAGASMQAGRRPANPPVSCSRQSSRW